MIYVSTVRFLARQGLAFPATQLIEDGRPAAPVGVFATMCEQGRDLVPTSYGLGSLRLEGLRNGLTRHPKLQGQAPRVQRGLRTECTRLLRASLQVVRMGEQGGDSRGDERGMQEGLQRARLLGVD